ncbi:MAG: glutamine-hydrolyzing carbamoyl-phosphate synthase small subunit [Deltaproteobacteria bacterium]|nr:glutamine-hydrolyzing carbamoyl-phosphate synthase small subunit [Deltaproteobacteria bacterium]
MKLHLEDESIIEGRAFGARREVSGEVVFNTGMSGYVETLTDPSYRGQILVLTYPLQGNYGVPKARAAEPLAELHDRFESGKIQVQGLVVLRHAKNPSHWACARTLGQWLESEGVPAIEAVDTRALTRKLRERGTMVGHLVSDKRATLADAKSAGESVVMAEVCASVAVPEVVRYEGGPMKVLVVDTGAKDSIIRSLVARGVSVVRVPFYKDLRPFVAECDGVLLSNGPGDPKDMMATVEQIRNVVFASEKPVFGVCMGNQLLGLAAGGDTVKLKYGHRSQNQPVQDLLTRRCYVTSQNHGYVVRDDSLPRDWEPWFVNVNDGSNEGIRCRARPWSSVQFHPEAAPGPEDAAFLFDDFLRLVGSTRV